MISKTISRISLLIAILLVSIITISFAEKIVLWNEAHLYYGEIVTVEGKIVSTYNSGKACFLNFHPDYKKYFTAVIFASDFKKFPQNPEDYYYEKTVKVTGLVKKYKAKPEIILKSPSQIEIVAGKPILEEKPLVISWEDADRYYGQYVTVEGIVVATYNSGKACFLNFHRNWKRYFAAVIFASSYDKFPPRPESAYLKKKVRVTGVIKEFKGKPEIIVSNPAQIEIVE